MMVFIIKVNNYMFRPSSGYHNYNFAQIVIYMSIYMTLFEQYIYITLFEQNCNCDNLKMAALGRNM